HLGQGRQRARLLDDAPVVLDRRERRAGTAAVPARRGDGDREARLHRAAGELDDALPVDAVVVRHEDWWSVRGHHCLLVGGGTGSTRTSSASRRIVSRWPEARPWRVTLRAPAAAPTCRARRWVPPPATVAA